MGMDVYGRAPKNEQGEYYRSSIWYWPSILEVIESTMLLPVEMLNSMAYNDGAGPDDDLAVMLANALDAVCAGMPDEAVFITTDERFTDTGTASAGKAMLAAFADAGVSSTDGEPTYSATVADIRAFAEFARNSGGFQVW